MKVLLQEDVGSACLNAIRNAAYTGVPVIRPIGFKVGDDSTVVGISDYVLEDMTTFISDVSRFVFCGKPTNLVVAACRCNGAITINDLLAGSGITAVGDTDRELLHSNSPVDVSVVFRLAAGNYTQEQNTDFMLAKGLRGFVATNSRHTNLRAFTFSEGDAGVFDVKIVTADGTDEVTVFKNAVNSLKATLESISLS